MQILQTMELKDDFRTMAYTEIVQECFKAAKNPTPPQKYKYICSDEVIAQAIEDYRKPSVDDLIDLAVNDALNVMDEIFLAERDESAINDALDPKERDKKIKDEAYLSYHAIEYLTKSTHVATKSLRNTLQNGPNPGRIKNCKNVVNACLEAAEKICSRSKTDEIPLTPNSKTALQSTIDEKIDKYEKALYILSVDHVVSEEKYNSLPKDAKTPKYPLVDEMTKLRKDNGGKLPPDAENALLGIMAEYCKIYTPEKQPAELIALALDFLDHASRLEHARWNAYMCSEGFVHGEKNLALKTHRCIVPAEQLALFEKNKDI